MRLHLTGLQELVMHDASGPDPQINAVLAELAALPMLQVKTCRLCDACMTTQLHVRLHVCCLQSIAQLQLQHVHASQRDWLDTGVGHARHLGSAFGAWAAADAADYTSEQPDHASHHHTANGA